MPVLPVVGGSYSSNSKSISAQKSVNCYPESNPGSANPLALVGVHGYVEHVDLGAPIRGLQSAWGRLYAVAGSSLYKVNANGTAVLLGVVGNDSLKADMTFNIFELLVLSSGLGYTVQKAGNLFAPINDPDFPISANCDFLDGYGMLRESDSGRFRFTTINDFETISGVDFATAEGAPDDLVSQIVDHRELWLMGEETIEVWDNVGAATNPFQRRQGAFVERGCRGAHSPAKVDNTIFWLGNNNVVYRADGITPVRISNHGIEDEINATNNDPVSMAYTWKGHEFFHMTFPDELTIVFDAATGEWHHREGYGVVDGGISHHALVGSTHYFGGADGKIYTASDENYQFGGQSLSRSRAIGPIRTSGFRCMQELTFVLETGENPDLATASEVFLEISDDGGRTYGNRILGSVGKRGEYQLEVSFYALGGFYDNQRVLRLSMTDNAKFVLIDAWVEIE